MVIDIVGKFAHVVIDGYENYGLDKGDLVFISGSGFSPVDDQDNYKLLFIVNKVVDNTPGKPITIARTSLELLPDNESLELLKSMDEHLAKAREETEAN